MPTRTVKTLSALGRSRPTPSVSERGSISIFIVTGGFAMILLVGMAVDLAGQVHAQQHARDVARQAARVGGQQLQAAPAIRGEGAIADTSQAVRAARAYLAASDVAGNAHVIGGDTIDVTTTAVYTTKFLSIIGIDRLTVTGDAQARITTAVDGVQR
ncbi:MAG: pilus assembly protein [Angustibacter sp.]